MTVKALIFDFDGTLCDTGEGIKKSAQYALESFGIQSPPLEELDYFIGPPLLVTFQERFGKTPQEADELIKKFRERYSTTGVFESRLYDGVKELLASLKNDGFKVGIASSKPQKFIEMLLGHFEIIEYFDAVCGVSFKADCESKESIISRCVDALGVEREGVLVVGDTRFDIDGAKKNSLRAVGVSWGYGNKFEFFESGADFVVDKPQDVEAVALGLYEQTDKVTGIFSGKVLVMHHDDVTLCNGAAAKRECVDHPGGVAVIGLTDDNCVPLVRQFRYPYKEVIFEIPAGKLEKGEDPFEAGKREFKEEVGAVAENYFSLGELYPTPGYTNEIIRLYGATGLRFEEQNLDDDEFLQIVKMPLDELVERVMSGEIKDAKTVAAALKLKYKMNENK
ncbi:MAG: HAD hydrolase-like protein [Eubacterium sp.]|nr:HAD hydrolase-like protein [Eubacterium sp.]